MADPKQKLPYTLAQLIEYLKRIIPGGELDQSLAKMKSNFDEMRFTTAQGNMSNTQDINLLTTPGRYTANAYLSNLPNAPSWCVNNATPAYVEVEVRVHNADVLEQVFTSYGDTSGVFEYRKASRAYLTGSGNFTQWTEIATATPPAVYDLPLADGVAYRNKSWYCKDQFGHVTVHLDVAASCNSGTGIAMLPEGFKAPVFVDGVAFTFPGGNIAGLGDALLETDASGLIVVYYPENDGQFRYFVGTLEFDV